MVISSQVARWLAPVLVTFIASAGDFISFQGPNAHFTYAYKVNAANQVVGYYVTDGNPRLYSGYVRQPDGTIVSILPNPIFSTALGINDSGTIAGVWADKTTNHGYVRDAAGNLTTFDVLNASTTDPVAINNGGTIAGVYVLNAVNMHGFVRDAAGKISTFDAPHSTNFTSPTAINDAGQITGWYFDTSAGMYQSFIRDTAGTFVTFNAPGATMGTFAYSINRLGEVTGYWQTSNGQPQGFVRDAGGNITVFNVSNAVSTTPYGINDSGTITGVSSTTQSNSSFVRAGSGSIAVFQLPGAGPGPLAGTSSYGINAQGYTVGSFVLPDGRVRAFLRQP